jgi:SAM-dependent methyltransferase
MIIDKEIKESIKRLIRKSSQNSIYELECIIGNLNRDINTRDDFVNILKRIKGKSRFSRMVQNNSLLISFQNENSPYSAITKHLSRVSISGNGLISEYARTNSLKNIIENVIFENKSYDNYSKDRLIDDNFNLRFNLKKEEELDYNSVQITNLVREWKQIDKYFRKKLTYTFYEEENDFKIDISIISSSKKFTYSKTLQESDVLKNKYISYEIEIEYIGNKKENIKSLLNFNYNNNNVVIGKKEKEKKKEVEDYQNYILDKYLDIINILLRAKQKSLFVIGIKDKIKVNKSFKELIKSDIDTYLPQPIDLEPQNIVELPILNYFGNDYDKNIRMDYAVTTKADGMRYLLFIDKDGKCYFKGRDSDKDEINSYKYTGTQIKDFSNSLFDGELISKTMDGKFIQNYYIFDAYIVKGLNISSYIFGDKKDSKSRYFYVNKLEEHFAKSDSVLQEENIESSYLLKIFKKNYFYGNQSDKIKDKLKEMSPKNIDKIKNKYDSKIFESINKILKKCNVKYGGTLEDGHLYSYPLDGLIFQPVNLGVNQNKVGEKVKKIGGTWKSVFRWKPPHELTIDFKVKFNKISATNSNQEFFYKDNKYIQATLFCKMWNTDIHRHILACKLINNGENIKQYNEDYAFSPHYPYNGKMDKTGKLNDITSQIYLKLDTNGNIRCKNGDIINDGNTIECGYDMNREERFRWIPNNIRPNKTPNSYMTAIGSWKLINNPIHINMIKGEQIIENNYTYYNKQSSNETASMRKFNNFVKGEIIKRGLISNGTKSKKILSPKSKYGIKGKNVMDLACGKMGDFLKYCLNGVDKLVGVDIMPDNLFNIDNGAGVRLLKTFSKDSRCKSLVNNTMMILGDCSKDIISGDAASDALNKYYLDIIYGRLQPKSGKLSRMFNIGINGFELVVCNFAIHYMFNTQDTLDIFLSNVKRNLNVGGYFVGTYLDANEILKSMGEKNKIEGYYYTNKVTKSTKSNKEKKSSKSIKNNDNKLIWSIEKVDHNKKLCDNEYINQKISVYMDTFYEAFDENLVNKDFLESQCARFGLELIDTKLFNDSQDSLFNEFKKENNKDYMNIDNNEACKQWTSFHRWFIFQKIAEK